MRDRQFSSIRPTTEEPFEVYYAPFPRWACSSIGQSRGLIIPWFQVRVLAGPPDKRGTLGVSRFGWFDTPRTRTSRFDPSIAQRCDGTAPASGAGPKGEPRSGE